MLLFGFSTSSRVETFRLPSAFWLFAFAFSVSGLVSSVDAAPEPAKPLTEVPKIITPAKEDPAAPAEPAPVAPAPLPADAPMPAEATEPVPAKPDAGAPTDGTMPEKEIKAVAPAPMPEGDAKPPDAPMPESDPKPADAKTDSSDPISDLPPLPPIPPPLPPLPAPGGNSDLFSPLLPRLPSRPAPAAPSALPPLPQPGFNIPKKTGTDKAAEEQALRVRTRVAKTKALQDPVIMAELERAESAKNDFVRREAMKNYYMMLHARMLKLDPGIKSAVTDSEMRASRRLVQRRVAPTQAPGSDE